jgi:hypothetical protein
MAASQAGTSLAEIVSNDLFGRFFWRRTGSTTQNWPCENRLHLPRKTHPSDVVFHYDEPYSLRRTYVNCDLKSYASKNINACRGLHLMDVLPHCQCETLRQVSPERHRHGGRIS